MAGLLPAGLMALALIAVAILFGGDARFPEAEEEAKTLFIKL